MYVDVTLIQFRRIHKPISVVLPPPPIFCVEFAMELSMPQYFSSNLNRGKFKCNAYTVQVYYEEFYQTIKKYKKVRKLVFFLYYNSLEYSRVINFDLNYSRGINTQEYLNYADYADYALFIRIFNWK